MSPDELSARIEIAELKARYCRGIDRCDLALLESVFWPDATVRYGVFDGPALEFARLTVATVREGCQATMHVIANALTELAGDEATSETYVLAYHSIASIESLGDLRFDAAVSQALRDQGATATAGRLSFVVGARYLDRCARRDGRWRISERAYVWDWCQLGPPNLLFDASTANSRLPTGRRDPSDLSYSILGPPAARAPAAGSARPAT
jgi:hypothetical protein